MSIECDPQRQNPEDFELNELETIFCNRYRRLEAKNVEFSLAANVKFRRSIFGIYMDYFNQQQAQDKLLNENKLGITEWELKTYDVWEKVRYKMRNDLVDESLQILKRAVKEEDVIDWNSFYNRLESLRISNSCIRTIDTGLLNFANLRVLILTGNYIERIPGKFLPRKLIFLECFLNDISDLAELTYLPPKELMHLGLGRNKLTDVSNCHLLADSRKFLRLRTLDLSDNDLYELLPVLETLANLPCLSGLLLEGNPCSVCLAYKTAVLSFLPRLIFLDNTEILEKDRNLPENTKEGIGEAAFVFTVHRITGLPAPPKEKNVLQTIHVEIKAPLLEDRSVEPEIEEENVEEEKEEKQGKGGKKIVKGKSSNTKKKSDTSKKKSTAKSGSKSSKKGSKKGTKVPSPYDAEDEHEAEKKIKNTSLKTEAVPWSKIIQFPKDAVVIHAPENDLATIRDTFRSRVNIKVIYLKTLSPPGKSKKKGAKPKNKSAAGSKKGKTKEEVLELPKEAPPQILKKVTLASFNCDLRSVNWSEETVDYFWAKHSKVGSLAIPIDGNLRAVNYAEGKQSKKTKPNGKKNKEKALESDGNPAGNALKKESIPGYFTCQIGFGLLRSYEF